MAVVEVIPACACAAGAFGIEQAYSPYVFCCQCAGLTLENKCKVQPQWHTATRCQAHKKKTDEAAFFVEVVHIN